jgi:PAS domain S-box-containing protein
MSTPRRQELESTDQRVGDRRQANTRLDKEVDKRVQAEKQLSSACEVTGTTNLEQGETEAVLAITGRERADEALHDKKALFSSIMQAAPIGIGLVANRIILHANRTLCDMLGYSAEELVNQSARMLYVTEEDYEYVGREKYAQIRDRGTGTVETRWRRKDGQIIEVILSSAPLDRDDLSKGVTFTVLDITDRKRAEEALCNSELRFRELADMLPQTVYEVDTAGRITYANVHGFASTGYTPTDITTGINVLEMVTPNDRERCAANMQQFLNGVRRDPHEYTMRRKDGSEFPAITYSAPILRDGQVMGIRGIVIDITERKKDKQDLKIANEILEAKHSALREKNLALKNVLEQVNSEKQELKAQIQSNVDRVVLPTLRLLRQKVDVSTAGYVDLLGSNLHDIASPLANRLESNCARLSPGEIEICSMIQKGLSSQEIANLRGVSVQTISMQRKRIRRKLGIANQSVSLPSLLKSLTY